MKIIVTHAGRFGDVLWAAPSWRALAEAYNTPVHVILAEKYGAIAPLLAEQSYIVEVTVDSTWQIEETAPITPRTPPTLPPADLLFHSSYEGWPEPTLAADVWRRAGLEPSRLAAALAHPWLTSPSIVQRADHPRVWVGWSEEHFELKVGLTVLLAQRFPQIEFWWLRPWGGRYDAIDHADLDTLRHALGRNVAMVRTNWVGLVDLARTCHAYLGCLSAPWVVANGLGIPAVVVEPNPQRHHPVFWSDGGGKNVLVRGGDGLPTWDARHAGEALEGVLSCHA